MTDLAGELALPSPEFVVHGGGSYFSADQMRDHGKACAESMFASVAAELREIIGNEYMDETARRRLLAALPPPPTTTGRSK